MTKTVTSVTISMSRQDSIKRFFYTLPAMPGVYPQALTACLSLARLGYTPGFVVPGSIRRMDTKQCRECGQSKPLTEFYTSGIRRGKQQYRPNCIACTLSPRTKERLALGGQGMKKCTKCQNTLPVDDFYDDRRKADGKRAVCKACHVASTGQYQKSERGHAVFIAAKTRYNHKPETQRKRVIYMRQQRISGKWADRESARHAVNQAVVNGTLPLVSSVCCADCGAQAREYHHASYDQERWLDVIPLCKDCHVRRHAQS